MPLKNKADNPNVATMIDETDEKRLKKGWTTGACATAATKAAFCALSTGAFPDPVSITLPKGETPSFAVKQKTQEETEATASVIKDAGDDPDVTHGAEIIATVKRGTAGSGIVFKAGEGVGTATLPGLPIGVGEPAINPGPRKMMAGVVEGDIEITISIPGGEKLAAKTMNPRLGIVGGLSVLGTTGVVVPYSCSAWIHAIQSGVDVARAKEQPHIAACTGSTSEATLRAELVLPDYAYIDMGDFIGGLLKYLRRNPVAKLTIGGGFAKLVKLAQGASDLHSKRSSVDFEALAMLLGDLGGNTTLIGQARKANTAAQVLEMAQKEGLSLGNAIASKAQKAALAMLNGKTEIEVIATNRAGKVVGRG